MSKQSPTLFEEQPMLFKFNPMLFYKRCRCVRNLSDEPYGRREVFFEFSDARSRGRVLTSAIPLPPASVCRGDKRGWLLVRFFRNASWVVARQNADGSIVVPFWRWYIFYIALR